MTQVTSWHLFGGQTGMYVQLPFVGLQLATEQAFGAVHLGTVSQQPVFRVLRTGRVQGVEGQFVRLTFESDTQPRAGTQVWVVQLSTVHEVVEIVSQTYKRVTD